MRTLVSFASTFTALAALALAGCGGSSSGTSGSNDPAEPAFGAARFSARSATVDHSFLPFAPGRSWVYEGQTADGKVERVEIFVSHETKSILGVECAIVIDRVSEDGELVEETFDWYGQDDEGNVWYLGEDSAEYEEGVVVGRAGSWEAGVDGAEAGIVMKAGFTVGDTYRQEFYAGQAEDLGQIVATNVTVALADGTSYTGCLQTRDFTPLEPGVEEFKYYAPGVGLVKEEKVDGTEPVELVETGTDREPRVDLAAFATSTAIDNPYLPLVPGTTLTYEAQTEDGVETTVVEVLADTRLVMGATCVVVRDQVFLDGVILEDTHDWFAQDADGNVWYFGEEVDNYNYDDQGVLVDITHEGAWEAGVDGARPGIIMLADPRVGDSYRQEYYAGQAEDLAAVVALDVTVTVPANTYAGCLQTLDRNPLEVDSKEHKYYAPGVGLVLETGVDGGDRVELVGITTTP